MFKNASMKSEEQDPLFFPTIDLTSGFWQMMLNPECRKFTAFTLPGIGQFEWSSTWIFSTINGNRHLQLEKRFGLHR